MAGASTPFQCLQEEVTCSVCLEYYKDPVTIEGGHSFCRHCIASLMGYCMYYCPQCGKKSEMFSLKTSIQLANVTEIAKQMQLQQTLCDLQGAGLTLFCKEDQTLVCVFCKAEDHQAHTVIPVEEAAQECKVQFHKVQDLLKKDMENFSTWESGQNYSISRWKDEIKEKKMLIQHCFRKAHQFLNEEEKLLLRRLKHEQDETLDKLEANLNTITSQKSRVQKLISEIEAKTQKPAPELLRDTKSIFTRKFSARMMKLFVFLLFAALVQAQCPFPGSCPIENLIDKRIEEKINSAVSSALARAQLQCTNVFENGALASCPSGYMVTGCSCGMACGSWDIRADVTCHCQCARIDWTSARCCKLG